MLHSQIRKLAISLALFVLLGAATARGQGYKLPNGDVYDAFKADGVVDKIAGGYMDMLVGDKRILVSLSQAKINEVFGQFRLDRELKFQLDIEATAEPDYLARGQLVSFSAELDARHTIHGELQSLAIILPSENSKPGVTPAGATSLVVGEVNSHRNGVLSIKTVNEQGRPLAISAKLADGAIIKAHVVDLSLVKKGDVVHVTGFNVPANKAGGKTAALGEVVSFELAKSLGKGKPGAAKKPDSKEGKVADADGKPDAAKPQPAMPVANGDPRPTGPIPGFDQTPAAAPAATPQAAPSGAPGATPEPSAAPDGEHRKGSRILINDYFSIDRDQGFDFDSRPGK